MYIDNIEEKSRFFFKNFYQGEIFNSYGSSCIAVSFFRSFPWIKKYDNYINSHKLSNIIHYNSGTIISNRISLKKLKKLANYKETTADIKFNQRLKNFNDCLFYKPIEVIDSDFFSLLRKLNRLKIKKSIDNTKNNIVQYLQKDITLDISSIFYKGSYYKLTPKLRTISLKNNIIDIELSYVNSIYYIYYLPIFSGIIKLDLNKLIKLGSIRRRINFKCMTTYCIINPKIFKLFNYYEKVGTTTSTLKICLSAIEIFKLFKNDR